jgi:hypothetical protein
MRRDPMGVSGRARFEQAVWWLLGTIVARESRYHDASSASLPLGACGSEWTG